MFNLKNEHLPQGVKLFLTTSATIFTLLITRFGKDGLQITEIFSLKHRK